ncbi:MAG: hypothetical protein ACOYJK_07055 [Prevotella sp.]|jgi:hypothetical protein
MKKKYIAPNTVEIKTTCGELMEGSWNNFADSKKNDFYMEIEDMDFEEVNPPKGHYNLWEDEYGY